MQNLRVVATDEAAGLILVRGAVPGSKGGWVCIIDAVKQSVPKEAPFPAGLRAGNADDAPAPAAPVEAPVDAPAAEDKKD